HPFVRVELHGVERRRQPFVARNGNLTILHHPLAFAEQAVDTPVDEHSELSVLVPLARLAAGDGDGIGGLRRHVARHKRAGGKRGGNDDDHRAYATFSSHYSAPPSAASAHPVSPAAAPPHQQAAPRATRESGSTASALPAARSR